MKATNGEQPKRGGGKGRCYRILTRRCRRTLYKLEHKPGYMERSPAWRNFAKELAWAS